MHRKSNSKVNRLRALNAELIQKFNYHAKISAEVINWVSKNGTDEQKELFTKFITDVCHKLAE